MRKDLDYEIRRELVRANRIPSVGRLNQLQQHLAYLPLDTDAMLRAADFWAYARHTGQPTAGDDTIDIDMILIAQAENLQLPNTIIATSNVGHLSRFFAAELWSNITP